MPFCSTLDIFTLPVFIPILQIGKLRVKLSVNLLKSTLWVRARISSLPKVAYIGAYSGGDRGPRTHSTVMRTSKVNSAGSWDWPGDLIRSSSPLSLGWQNNCLKSQSRKRTWWHSFLYPPPPFFYRWVHCFQKKEVITSLATSIFKNYYY